MADFDSKHYQIIQKTSENGYICLHPETDASIVKLSADNKWEADTVEEALNALEEEIVVATGGGVTGIKFGSDGETETGLVTITAEKIGLGNVDNTSDADKPISDATQTALDAKQDTLTFDEEPTEGSENPVTSGGVYTAIKGAEGDYYTKSEIDETVEGLEETISQIPKYKTLVVEELPTTDIDEATVYLVPSTDSDEAENMYTEYIYNSEIGWEKLGEQKFDPSNYVTKDDLADELGVYEKTADLEENYYDKAAIDEKLANVQESLTIDTELDPESTNPVENKAIYAGVQEVKEAAATAQTAAETAQSGVDEINEKLEEGIEAATAKKLSEAVKIGLDGDVTGEAEFDGSEDVTITATLAANGVNAGTYSAVAVDETGRVTAGANSIEFWTADQTSSDSLATNGIAFIPVGD